MNNALNTLKAKKNSKKGFTLMEMLIVVAIIAILVAIAIPTFSSSLTKAKEAADEANIRSAYATVLMENMADGTEFPTTKEAFIAKAGGNVTLNYSELLTYSADDDSISITYDAKKVDKLELNGTAAD